MSFIEVQNLRKEFRVFRHREGVWGAFKDLFHRKYQTLAAVDGINLSVDRGEFIGYIGPNGAGKSTTIKMLTGILMPSSGVISANGFRPYHDRTRYTKSIGVVFGQRTQLWWDIAVIESFKLLRRIYDVSENDFSERMGIFRELLGLDEFLHSPVRKLSLGQRMRCDIAAALLHYPRILFLDEPTIGLDVVAKDRIREFLKEINRSLNTTIFLTTHDLSDIEELCRRIIIIDHGRLIYDGTLEELRRRFGRINQINVHLEDRRGALSLDRSFGNGNGVQWEHVDDLTYRIRYDREQVSSAEIIRKIVNEVPVRDIYIEAQPIEEIIKRIYNEGLGMP
ncbi:MAG TPA: ATP-binding cassette domain-containing protein [Acidobacteriota bacterium]|nr:ATP-binding cassette domain-containing protein [Acidobacteriota bacterium]